MHPEPELTPAAATADSEPRTRSVVGRRTVLVGAAWTIPAVALATAAPAAAASPVGALRFAAPFFAANVGGSIGSVALVSLDDGSKPLPGVDFTVELPAGFAFPSRAGSRFTGVTNAQALAILPDIAVAPGAQNGTMTATSSTAASATAELRALGNAFRLVDDGAGATTTAESAVPPASTPLGGYRSWLTPSGDLIVADLLVASGVKTAVGYLYDDSEPKKGATHIAYVAADGSARVYRNWRNKPPVDTEQSLIPAGSTPLEAWSAWLSPSGDLYQRNQVIASGVTRAVAYQQDQQSNRKSVTHIAYTDAAGAAWVYVDRYDGKPELLRQSKIPDGSTPIGTWNAWLAPNGDLYQTDKVVTSGVSFALGYQHDPGSSNTNVSYIAYRDMAGNAFVYQDRFDGKPVLTAQSMVPAGSQPLKGWSYWLAPDGRLFRQNFVVHEHVSAAAGFQYDGGSSDHSDTYLNFVAATLP